jgi:solute carrier family 12 sodium/potassium/chloride transporter 2
VTEADETKTLTPPAEEPGVPVTADDVTRPPDEETLQERIEEKKAPTRKLYGTFAGVFTPTLLTILGVIMYLREGWVVGNAGLLGAWLIILISFIITTTTGLSLSSITTNIRIGAGGAFSIISQSLGLEVGGSIGIPLYLAQALAVVMYIFGFRAGWRWIFPDHPAILVDFGVFALLFIIAYISAGLAFRVQYLILLVIASSLVSVAYAAYSGSMTEPITWWGAFPGSIETGFSGIAFWGVFAVYFPAATGIMAGLNMSGELKDPRRSIPLGTMSAIAVSLVIYICLAYWLARTATPDELVRNYTVMIERSAYGPLVLGGLLGATFSSALASIVGAPRILQALGEHNILPRSEWFAKRSVSGEPRNAMLFTGAIVVVALMFRNLNAVAPLVTMFFLLTYGMINVVVLIEQSLRLVSFRPLFRIPKAVPFVGTVGCLFAMFIVNPIFSLVAVVIVLAIHGTLIRRHLKAPFGDVRSGLFVAIAEWAAKKVNDMAASKERTWTSNLLIPVEDPQELRGSFNFIRDIAYPKGFIKILGLSREEDDNRMRLRLPSLAQAFQEAGVFASWTIIDVAKFEENLVAGMQALGGAFFKPSVIFLRLPESSERDAGIKKVIQKASESRLGVLLFADHPKAGLGRRKSINLWIEDRSPNWDITMELGNMDLAILIAYKLKRNWKASLNLITFVKKKHYVEAAHEYLTNLIELARIPNAQVYVVVGGLESDIAETPLSSLNIFSLPPEPDLDFVRQMVNQTQSACLFALDSGDENALV